MPIKRTLWVENDELRVQMVMKFEEINNCCGILGLDYYDCIFENSMGLHYPEDGADVKEFLPLADVLVDQFENMLRALLEGHSQIVFPVVDYAKKIVSWSDASYPKQFSPWYPLVKLSRRRGTPIQVKWGPSIVNSNSGNHLKIGIVIAKNENHTYAKPYR